jgi:hypothetical protein
MSLVEVGPRPRDVRARVHTALVVGVLAISAGACGDGGPAAVRERLPPDRFELRLSQICTTYDREWAEWEVQLGDPGVDLADVSRQAHQIARRMADDLLEIEPEGRERAWSRATAMLDSGLDAVAANDPPELRHPHIRTARDSLIDEFGADGCFA